MNQTTLLIAGGVVGSLVVGAALSSPVILQPVTAAFGYHAATVSVQTDRGRGLDYRNFAVAGLTTLERKYAAAPSRPCRDGIAAADQAAAGLGKTATKGGQVDGTAAAQVEQAYLRAASTCVASAHAICVSASAEQRVILACHPVEVAFQDIDLVAQMAGRTSNRTTAGS
jgi:hypothetical protein